MSNQVYSNATTKYYDSPGLNVFAPSAPIAITTPSVVTIINFGSGVVFEQFPNQISFNPDGTVNVLESGMYSIQYTIMFTQDTPETNDAENTFNIWITRPGQFTDLIVAQWEQRWVARGGSSGDPDAERKLTLSYTGYLNIGDIFWPTVVNWVTTSGMTIQPSSNFILSKIY